MKACALLVTWLAIVTAQNIPTDGDPCMASQYLTLDEPGRSTAIRPMSEAEVLDDSNLPDFWYRFTNPTGGTMPETCPGSATCSTLNMAWMDDTHPPEDGELHSKKICINDGGVVGCESSCFFILVKNCGFFYVYKLKGLSHQTAYCSGSGTACPFHQTSPTGYTPCAAPEDIPEPPTSPEVGLVTETKNFSLTCTFTSPDTEALHEVRWIAGGNIFLAKDLAAGERTATATEFELFYRGSTVVGHSVMCEVRAYKEGIAVGTAWVSSPQPGYFLGIKVVDIEGNEVLEVEIDEDSKIPKLVFLKTTVPIRCNTEKWEGDKRDAPWINEESCAVAAHVVNKDFEDFARDLHGECPEESKETLKTIAGQLEFLACVVKIKANSWEDHRLNSVTIRAVKDKIFDGRQSRYISFIVDINYQNVWKGYEFPYLKVTALDTRQPNVGTSTCTSYNDPHLKTFDGTVYHNYNEGEYVLYQNLEFNFRVHAYYKACNVKKNTHASCNCGVAAQAGNDVIILARCRKFGEINIFQDDPDLQDKTYLRQRVFQRGDMTKGFTLEHESGTKIYKIKFPHGAVLTLTLTDHYDKQFVNLEMSPSQLDYSDDGAPKTEGLCGVFSRTQHDDLRLPDGRTYQARDSDSTNIYKQFIPDEFNLAWRIERGSSKSLYRGEISDERDYDAHRFCACVNNHNTEKAEVLCAFGDDCRTLQDITGIVRTRTEARRKRREADEPADNDYFMEGFDDSTWDFDFRSDSFLSTVKDLYEDVEATTRRPVLAARARPDTHARQGPRGVPGKSAAAPPRAAMDEIPAIHIPTRRIENSPWPTESGKTEQYARTFCTDFVHNSEAVKACENIADVNFQDDIEMCISDIALSDTTDFAISAVQSIVTKCSEKVNSDMTLWTLNTDPRTKATMKMAPPAVVSNMCPNDCSMNGVCANGKCTCNEGFMGADCSGNATVPPSILVLAGGGRCDYKQRPCRSIPVLGENFIDGASLKCRFQTAEGTRAGWRDLAGRSVGAGEVLETTPEFESYMEIHCALPRPHIEERGENAPPRAYLISITNNGQVMSNTKPLLVYDGARYICPSAQGPCTVREVGNT